MPAQPERTRPPVRLAVLDIAGTTVQEHNSVYLALEQAVVAAGARPGADGMQAAMGADKHEAIAGLLGAELGSPEIDKTYADFRDRLRQAYRERPPVALPGVKAALQALRAAGVRVVLTTGFTREVTDDVLGAVGWRVEQDVDAVVCAEDVGAGRPAPYMVFEAMRRTGVHDVRHVLVAGDTELDLRSGAHAGAAMVVGVLSGAMDAEQLGRTAHTHLLPSVADLPALLGLPTSTVLPA